MVFERKSKKELCRFFKLKIGKYKLVKISKYKQTLMRLTRCLLKTEKKIMKQIMILIHVNFYTIFLQIQACYPSEIEFIAFRISICFRFIKASERKRRKFFSKPRKL